MGNLRLMWQTLRIKNLFSQIP